MKKRDLLLDVLLTILTCGLWNLVVQYEQIKTLNIIYREEKYNIWLLSLFSILTCFIYYIYFEYRKSVDFARFSRNGQSNDSDAIIAILLTVVGMPWIYDTILQEKINEYIDQQSSFINNIK